MHPVGRTDAHPDRPDGLAAHRLSLAQEVLDDIELSKLPAEQLLLKTSRLARLVDDKNVREWLEFELRGYFDTESGRSYMTAMKRWTDEEKGLGYWMPLASLLARVAVIQAQVQQLRVPDVSISLSSSNPNEWVGGSPFGPKVSSEASSAQLAVLGRISSLSGELGTLLEVRSRVMTELHLFAVRTYYQLAFSDAAESIFEDHRRQIDGLLREHSPEAVEKIPSIVVRLRERDSEAISQALSSCRRMIKAFADAVHPPQAEDVESDAERYSVGSDKVLNRIKHFLEQRCSSRSRRSRLSRALKDVWERASAGTHSDAIEPEEARALFLQAYMTLGEILSATGGLSSLTDSPATD